jgi:superfamily II DNA or RNA helicase
MSDNSKLPTLVDNLPANTMLDALKRLLPLTDHWDIATGTFEIGSLLALDGLWQRVQKIRILMGDETTRRTRRELVDSLRQASDDNIEMTKAADDAAALTGLDAVRQALQSKQIHVKVYSRAKFHAKAYRLETKGPPVDYALIGSSNFTEPGLTRNLELNLFTTDQSQHNALKTWFQGVWEDGEEVNPDIIGVIERHLRVYGPFELWAKALYEFFADRETPETLWECNQSVMYPELSRYQQDGYRMARKIAQTWDGAFICDGVGLGKTFIGLMLLEYHLHRGDRVLLIVPRSARESVWQRNLERYIYPRYRIVCREHLNVLNHTDFGRPGTIPPDELAFYRDYCDVVMVDEAHHFRTPSANRSKTLMGLMDGRPKQCYFLTATPINNSLLDLYHLINYLARNRQDRFAGLGIRHLRRYFGEAEKRLEAAARQGRAAAAPDVQAAAQQADILRTDHLLKELVIQRSRAYVQDSERATQARDGRAGAAPLFPERQKPRVKTYSLKKVYAGLYDDIAAAFSKDDPLLSLAAYNPEPFRKGQADAELLNRDRQVIGLIRTLLLKRLESSYRAFEGSLEDLLRKMAGFLRSHAEERWDAWRAANATAWDAVQQHLAERRADDDLAAEGEEGNDLDEAEFAVRPLDPDRYDLERLLGKVADDMTLLADLLRGVHASLSPRTDDKLRELVDALRADPQLRAGKVVIFTEFRDTARYLWKQLRGQGFTAVEELDGTRDVDRETVIKRFAPYYNCKPEELPRYLANPIRVLVSTDVLSEGLNLQDASLIVNYDLHWNPVRLMQRIGRVDRRLSLETERALGRDGQQPLKVYVYNFLPPGE